MLKTTVLENAKSAYVKVAQALVTLEEIGYLEYLRDNAVMRLPDPDSPNYAQECLVESGRSSGYREVFNSLMALVEVEVETAKKAKLTPTFGAKQRLIEKGLIRHDRAEQPVSNGTTA